MNRTLAVLPVLVCLSTACSAPAAEKDPVVVIDTTFGPIKVELDAHKAPTTVQNFLAYVDDKFYDGTIFHRIVPGFVIQGGGMGPDMREKQTKPAIKNEAGNGLSNARGTIAMARTQVPDSATAQFYINLGDNTALDRANAQDGFGYCVFGKVTDGMAVVDKIGAVKRGPGDVPTQPVLIKSVRREGP